MEMMRPRSRHLRHVSPDTHAVVTPLPTLRSPTAFPLPGVHVLWCNRLRMEREPRREDRPDTLERDRAHESYTLCCASTSWSTPSSTDGHLAASGSAITPNELFVMRLVLIGRTRPACRSHRPPIPVGIAPVQSVILERRPQKSHLSARTDAYRWSSEGGGGGSNSKAVRATGEETRRPLDQGAGLLVLRS